MKKKLVIVFCFMLAISLVGCATQKDGEKQQEHFAENENETENISDAPIITDAPALTVVCGEKSVKAWRGEFSWIYQDEDGISTGITHDAVHSKEVMTPLYLPHTTVSSEDQLNAYLQWDTAPDSVSVYCWNEKCWEQPDAESETIPVDTLITENINGGFCTSYSIELKDGSYIYGIKAEWNRGGRYAGKVCYGFYTVPVQ